MKRRYVILIISAALVLSSLLFLPLETLGASTVADLNAATATATEQSRKVFKNPRGLNEYYVFYLDDADNFIRYANSADGVSWTSGQAASDQPLEPITGDESSWATAIYDDGSQLHVYLAYEKDTNGRLTYRHGNISDASTTITWAAEAAFGGYAQEAYGVSLALASNGRLFVAWSDERTAGSEAMRVFAFDTIPAGDLVSGDHTALTETDRLIVTANPTGTADEINAVYQEGTTILNGVKVTSDGTSPTFGTKSELTGMSLTRAKISAATDTQATPETHVAYRNGTAVEHRTYNEASGFSGPTTVLAATPDSVSLAIDERSAPDKVFVLYVKNGVAGSFFYKTAPVDSLSFGTENEIADGTGEGIDYLSAGVKDWGADNRVQVAYTTQTTFLVRFVHAEEGQGPFYAGAVGTNGFTNPANAVGSEEATCAEVYGTSWSGFWNTFGFNISSDATINGIQVEIKQTWQSDPPLTNSLGVVVGKSEAILGVEKTGGAQTSGACGAGQSIDTYGGPTDLWGLSWTPADLSSDSFTVRLRNADGTGFGIFVNWIRVTVYYTLSTEACGGLTVTTSDPAGQLWFNETVEPDGLPFTTQVNVSASFQDGVTPALSVTNDGTGTCDITIRLMSDPGIGRTLKFNTSNSAPWPTDTSREVPLTPSSVTVCSSVAPSGTCDIWLWADYESAVSGQTVADVRVETI